MGAIYSRLLGATKSGRLDSSFVADLMPEWASSKIHWSRLSKPKNQALSEEPKLGWPGIYVWLTTRDIDGREKDAEGRELMVPRKVGLTGWNKYQRLRSNGTLRDRMLKRYVKGVGEEMGVREDRKKRQVPLAVEYQGRILEQVGDCSNIAYCERMDSVREKGLGAFPLDALTDYNKEHQGSRKNARYNGAVDWALHGGPGLARLYVVVAPMKSGNASELPLVEHALSKAASAWNHVRGLPSLYDA